ncbi:hypothetical protein IFO70_23815 [Phormidium tenue FACHB-886]|nr:hypothetical protein [Phormidium tenue FACHB-886]
MNDLAILITQYILHYLRLERNAGRMNMGWVEDSQWLWQEIDRYPQIRWVITEFALNYIREALAATYGQEAVSQFEQEIDAKGIEVLPNTARYLDADAIDPETLDQRLPESEQAIEITELHYACQHQIYAIVSHIWVLLQLPSGISTASNAPRPQVWSVDDLRHFLTTTLQPVGDLLGSAIDEGAGAPALTETPTAPASASTDSPALDVPDRIPAIRPSRSPLTDSYDWNLLQIGTLLGYFLLKAIHTSEWADSPANSDRIVTDPPEALNNLLSNILPSAQEGNRSGQPFGYLDRQLLLEIGSVNALGQSFTGEQPSTPADESADDGNAAGYTNLSPRLARQSSGLAAGTNQPVLLNEDRTSTASERKQPLQIPKAFVQAAIALATSQAPVSVRGNTLPQPIVFDSVGTPLPHADGQGAREEQSGSTPETAPETELEIEPETKPETELEIEPGTKPRKPPIAFTPQENVPAEISEPVSPQNAVPGSFGYPADSSADSAVDDSVNPSKPSLSPFDIPFDISPDSSSNSLTGSLTSNPSAPNNLPVHLSVDRPSENNSAGISVVIGSAGNQTLVINAQSEQITIANFGGVGKGVVPSDAVMAGVDILKFEGAGLLPEQMNLTQMGSNLVITFETAPSLQVTLKDFVLENLDNLTTATWASITTGNILFEGQSATVDSFDVIDADQDLAIVLRPNAITYLNALDNHTQGFDAADDQIHGQGGNDTLSGLSGNDHLRGEAGNDVLLGGAGDDTLVGGAGDDTLVGGAGDDTLVGSTGSDRFVLKTDAGVDVISDFQAGIDRIQLAEGLLPSQLTIVQEGSNTRIEFDQQKLAILIGITATELTQSSTAWLLKG